MDCSSVGIVFQSEVMRFEAFLTIGSDYNLIEKLQCFGCQ